MSFRSISSTNSLLSNDGKSYAEPYYRGQDFQFGNPSNYLPPMGSRPGSYRSTSSSGSSYPLKSRAGSVSSSSSSEYNHYQSAARTRQGLDAILGHHANHSAFQQLRSGPQQSYSTRNDGSLSVPRHSSSVQQPLRGSADFLSYLNTIRTGDGRVLPRPVGIESVSLSSSSGHSTGHNTPAPGQLSRRPSTTSSNASSIRDQTAQFQPLRKGDVSHPSGKITDSAGKVLRAPDHPEPPAPKLGLATPAPRQYSVLHPAVALTSTVGGIWNGHQNRKQNQAQYDNNNSRTDASNAAKSQAFADAGLPSVAQYQLHVGGGGRGMNTTQVLSNGNSYSSKQSGNPQSSTYVGTPSQASMGWGNMSQWM